ncbi:hypothetical protein [Streptomyces sp. enrichment culture]|uniref:hypothetical protein n=1 Tax=Streptomyces sp. enrichment culture TaxID=1795815 RepID=UPI003F57912E
MESNLRALPGLYQESLHHVAPIARRVNQTRVSGSRNRDRLDLSVLDARNNIMTILESWSVFVTEKLGNDAPARSVPNLSRFLLRHLEWLVAQPPAADFADEIDGLRLELLHTIDPAPGEHHVSSRECVVDDCTGTINTSPQRIGNTGKRSIQCSSGHTWEMHEWITLRPLMERQRKAVST